MNISRIVGMVTIRANSLNKYVHNETKCPERPQCSLKETYNILLHF